ncbi:unnamed protein product [Mytilus edulis]|uniref:Apextrin C-terminal domain-containing protein n=1 Tax=Mytilus edulis TaxID=6550 RepID=A0A8S3TFF5_MYTED|nr:unnamed protein product [Mytilus edulis]
MKDVSPADNLSCEEPNISGPGLLKFGKCSKIGVLLRYHQLSLLECVKECLITSQCISINYRHNWNLCDVVTSVSNSNDMDNDTTSDGSAYSRIDLPTTKPFYLYKYTSTCQRVRGMTVRDEYVKMDDEDYRNNSSDNGCHPKKTDTTVVHYCYYS